MRVLWVLLLTFCGLPSYSQFTEFDSLDFTMPDSIAAWYRGHSLKDREKLAQLLTKDFPSDVDKFRCIFKWVTDNISYDLDLFHENNQKNKEFRFKRNKLTSWRKQFDKKLMKRLVQKKSSICSGYAMLLKELCQYAGISCETIFGYGRTNFPIGRGSFSHAWNAVRLNDRWYLCDPTWASGYVDEEELHFTWSFNKNYFLTDPQLFSVDHFPSDPNWFLTFDKPTIRNFLDAPIKKSGFIQHKLNHYRPEIGRMNVTPDSLMRFSFTSNLPAKSMKSVHVDIRKKSKRSFKSVDSKIIDLFIDKEGYYYFSFNLCDKGEFRVLIFYERKFILGYEVFSK
ncbi:MAG: hypothetical protein HOP30_03035 [Cyclobacteriaceae bacterium]|nr:hypothetical protein [Cyclobacteriaceae bacterium]